MRKPGPRRSAENPCARPRISGGAIPEMHSATLHVLVVVFVATLIRSSFGFGEALIAVPLLAFFIPLHVAAPLAVLISITIAAVVVVQDWEKIHFSSAGWLLLATIPGVPLGLLLLTNSNQSIVRAVLGFVILAFGSWSLVVRRPPELRSDSRGFLIGCGFLAGVLGGAYGINGPPLVVYGSMRRWTAQHFRATLQAYFLPASMLGMCGYWLDGLWTSAVTRYYLLSLPVMLPAVFLGRSMNHRLRGDTFLKSVYAGLAGIGLLLLMQAFGGRL